MIERDQQILIGQLLAMRAQIDVSLVTLGVSLEDDTDDNGVIDAEDERAPVCPHPRTHRLDMTCFDGPEHWRCLDCGHDECAPDVPTMNTVSDSTTHTTTEE